MIVNASEKHCQSEVIRKALEMLNMIERSSEDNLIYNHVTLLLENYDQKQAETEQLLCSLISLILGAFSIHLEPESTLYTQIKLLQFRLTSPITNTELVALQHYVESCADQITQSEIADSDTIKESLQPLIRSFGLDNENAFGIVATNASGEEYTSISRPFGQISYEAKTAIKDFGKSLQQFFSANSISSSIEQSEKFGVLLEVELAALKGIDDQDAFEVKKKNVLVELEKLLSSHKKLTSYFQTMSDFVSTLQEDSARLNEELGRVTLLSLTDELTGLPNRRAFIQRLQDEIARVKRYGHELSIALLDIDHFKPINDHYGHNAGDKVLKCYADTVLSTFRQHDMVARYGGEEFVVIFPNTAIVGALQALKKVQKRAENSQIELNNEVIRLPTFSAGLVEYHGETNIDTLIHRADTILYEAKSKGRNRIELEVAEHIP